MILNLLAVSIILLLTLYLSTQGTLSATISLITAIFASVLSMALFEPLEMITGNYRPEYARGVTFLVLFFLSFSGLRIAADLLVPKNVVIPSWMDRLGGALMGFFSAMMVVGSTIIGVEMLPIGTAVLFYDRYPNENRMQAVKEESGKLVEIPGAVGPQSSIWLSPDHFVLDVWNLTSAGSLGGNISFTQCHPDLSMESYGYRNVVQFGAGRALLKDLAKVTDAYRVKEPADLKRFHLADSGLQAVVIRTEIEQGVTQPHVSADTDSFFRITPTQIRLVTDHGHQYYPVGYLLEGTTFTSVSLSNSVLVEDFPASLKIVHDWVFPIAEDEKPLFLEIKQLARFDAESTPALAKLEKAPRFGTLTEADYPPRNYRKNPSTFTLTAMRINSDKTRTPIKGADVYILFNTVVKRDIDVPASQANTQLLDNLNAWNANEKGWGDHLNNKPGVPGKYALENEVRIARDEIKLKAPGDFIQWSLLVPTLLTSDMTTDGPRNLEAVNHFFDEVVVPLFKSPTATLVEQGVTGSDGQYTTKLAKGTYVYIVRYKSGDFFGVWMNEFSTEPKSVKDENVNTDDIRFKIDMRKK